jgi:hypothetical protein
VGSKRRVDFKPEVDAYGLRLCPGELKRANFIKDDEGKVAIIDFEITCFLPVSFFALSLCLSINDFDFLISPLINKPESTQLKALLRAHNGWRPFRNSNFGKFSHVSFTRTVRQAPLWDN